MAILSDSTWQMYCDPTTARTAQRIARNIAGRLRDETMVHAASELAIQQSQYPDLLRIPMAMATGFPGLALLASYLDQCFPDEGWDDVGHIYLQKAVQDMQAYLGYTRFSLSQGLAGVAFAAWSLSRHGKRYQRLLGTLDQQLVTFIQKEAEEVIKNQTHGCLDASYDVISGLTGVGAYLLCRTDHAPAAQALSAVLTALVYLAEERDGIPHWYTPTSLAPERLQSLDLGCGFVNLGLAHGIAGPLALLSLARAQGIEVAGMDETICSIANWLVDHQITDEWGINWPTIAILGGSSERPEASRAAWCYGIPGMARSLWLAGHALQRADYQELAVAAMGSVYRRPLQVRGTDSPGFCHGVAGLLHITLRFARSTGKPGFFQEVQSLSEQLISLYQPDSLVGYRHREIADTLVDNPWLLDGAAGVASVLLAASTPCEPAWDRLFLLS